MSWPTELMEEDYAMFIADDPADCAFYKQGAPVTEAASFQGRLIPYVIMGEERQAVARIGPFTAVGRGQILFILPQEGIEFTKEDSIQITYAGKTQVYRVQDCIYFPEHTEVSIRKYT